MKVLQYVHRKGVGAIDAPTAKQFRGLAKRYRREAVQIRSQIAWLGIHPGGWLAMAEARMDLIWCERAIVRLEHATCWADLAFDPSLREG